MTDLHSLLTRVAAATGPDRELDADIDVALFGGETIWLTANYTMEQYPASRRPSASHIRGYANEHVPLVTASLDAALALVAKKLPGWDWSVRHSVSADGDVRYANAVVWRPSDPRDDEAPRHWANHDHSPALALLSALLRALIAKQEGADGNG